MADAKISALTELTTPANDDVLAIVDTDVTTTKKIQYGNLVQSRIPSTWVAASTHLLTGSTALGDATGLGFSVSSASMYRWEFTGAWQTTSSAVGIGMSVNVPAAVNMLVWERAISTGLGLPVTISGNTANASSAVVPQSSAANNSCYFYLGGTLYTGANAGTLQLRYASETAGSTVSIRAGSVGFLWGPL